MAKSSISVKIEIEPVVKLDCMNKDCKHNLIDRGYSGCNLKYISISKDGKCKEMSRWNNEIN